MLLMKKPPPWFAQRLEARGLQRASSLLETPYLRGRPHPVAPVRAFLIIETHDPAYQFFSLFEVFRASHPVKPFLLDDAVHPFGDGVVGWGAVLGHAYAYIRFSQPFDIQLAAILRSPIGMMDQRGVIVSRELVQGQVQGVQRMFRPQGLGKGPAYDLTREGVCQ